MDNGILGLDEPLCDCLCTCGIKSGFDGDVAVEIGACEEVFLDLSAPDVHRHIDKHRAGSAGFCETECLIENVGESFCVVDSPAAFADWLEHSVLCCVSVHIDFLMRMFAVVVARYVAGENNHRD